MMKLKLLGFVLLMTGAVLSLSAQKPNIIVIMADDMGYSDIGCFGGEIQTPNLDQLANQGLRMTQFYNASRCCPSRASLLTGLYPHQAGVGAMVNPKPYPGYQGYLNNSSVTIAEVLKQAGYHTYMAGKWHVGQRPEHWPRKRGFDKYFGLIDGASNYFNPTLPYRPNQKLTLALNDEAVQPTPDFYATDDYTDFAISCIQGQENKQQPFFLYLAYTSPHWPLQALKKNIEKYKDKYKNVGWDQLRAARLQRMIKMGLLPKQTQLSTRDGNLQQWDRLSTSEKADWDDKMAIYAAMIDRMDQNIGRLIRSLEQTGQRENTVIMFLSDNGASHEEIKGSGFLPEIIEGSQPATGKSTSFAAYGKEGANLSNSPFRSYKHWQYEGGIATPFIVNYPALIKGGSIDKQPAHIADILPTCLDLAGVPYPKVFNGNSITPVAGLSLLPVIKGDSWSGHDAIYFEHEGNKAVRKGDWKIVASYPQKTWELYHIAKDRSETVNLADQHADKVAEMEKLYLQWAERSWVLPYDQILKR